MSVLSSIAALLASVVLLISGNALIAIAAPLQARVAGFADLTVGLLGSAYFSGMLGGTLGAPALIARAGHVRAFAAFVALAVASVVLMPIVPTPSAWLFFRAVTGFVFAGLYAVIEAWINARASNANRARLYALYQIANFGATAAGQMALRPLGPESFEPFAVSGALLALAIVPMALTRVEPPAAPRTVKPRLFWLARVAPLACLTAFAAGAANGASISLSPIFAADIGMSAENVPLFTSAIVLGSALGIFPIAAISDRMDRRLVIAVAMTFGAVLEIALARFASPSLWIVGLGFLVGLATYSLYTLTVSLANDGAAPQDLIHISVGLLFIYCVAAIASPAIASVLMRDFGPQALFVQNAFVHGVVAAVAFSRVIAGSRAAGRSAGL